MRQLMEFSEIQPVEIIEEKDITASQYGEIRTLMSHCFEDLPPAILTKVEEEIPKYRCLLKSSEGILIGNLCIYERVIETQIGDVRVGILGDIGIASGYRRKGYASLLIEQAHAHLLGRGIDFSILFAIEPEVYVSSGYQLMSNPMTFWDKEIQEPRWRTLIYRGSMYCELRDEKWPDGNIDLRGPTV